MTNHSQITAFLKQRLMAAKKGCLHDSHKKQRMIENLLRRFDLIRAMPDRRVAMEVAKFEEQITDLLPSATGRQAKVRERIILLISKCKIYDAINIRRSGQPRHAAEFDTGN